MLSRLLLDPVADAGGSPSAQPAPAPAPTPAPKIELTIEQWQRLNAAQDRLDAIEAENRVALEAKEAERLAALVAKGQADEALNQLRAAKDTAVKAATDRADGLEAQILGERKSGAIATHLLPASFVSEAAANQVKTILDSRFEAVRDATTSTVTVREKGTGRPAADVIREFLASPDAAHFLRPSTQGGANATGGNRTTPTPAVTPEKPETVSDALIRMEREKRASPAGTHYGLTYRAPRAT